MRKLLGHLLGIVLLSTSSLVMVYSQPASLRQTGRAVQSAPPKQPGVLVEEFSFLIKDFKMDHQTQTNNLNLSISYRYMDNAKKADYPDFRWLAKDVETFLTDYPNDEDYWEIVNKQITEMLLKKYPSITSLTCELKVDPSSLIPYTRTSRVTRHRPDIRGTRVRSH